MVKHIILWTLKSELTEAEKAKVKKEIKEGLEGLKGKIPGLVDIKVNIDGRLTSSNADRLKHSFRLSRFFDNAKTTLFGLFFNAFSILG